MNLEDQVTPEMTLGEFLDRAEEIGLVHVPVTLFENACCNLWWELEDMFPWDLLAQKHENATGKYLMYETQFCPVCGTELKVGD